MVQEVPLKDVRSTADPALAGSLADFQPAASPAQDRAIKPIYLSPSQDASNSVTEAETLQERSKN